MAIIKNYDYVVKNPDMTLNHRIKNIIAGFPGVGKSTAAKNKDWMFLDIESSDYHWVVDGEGNKVCHPEWPINYVDAIMEAAKDMGKPQLYILISTHNEVLTELDKRGIYYNAVLPRSKDIYLQRYRERGNTEEFITKLDVNFDTFIKSVESTNVFGIYYTDDYLFKIFVPNDTDEYPYKVFSRPDTDMCYYEFRAENLPTVHTNKPIIAVLDPAMIRDYKYLELTSYSVYMDYLNINHITAAEQSYTDFIKCLADSPIYKHSAVFVEATEPDIIEFHKNKLNFILAIPETYVPQVHTLISSIYGNHKEIIDAYIKILKCYSFRTMVSDFYIDDAYINIPNFDSICLIKAMDSITGITASKIAYDPDRAALPFRELVHEYLASIEEDTDDKKDGSLTGSEILSNFIVD